MLGKSHLHKRTRSSRRWEKHLEHYKDTATRINEKQTNFVFHLNPGATMDRLMLDIECRVQKFKDKDGKDCSPKSDIPVSRHDPKFGQARAHS